jgi:hypothetical protein
MTNTSRSLSILIVVISKVLVLENLVPVGLAAQQVEHR